MRGWLGDPRPRGVADFFVNVLLIFWVRDYTQQGLGQVHEKIDSPQEAGH